MSQTENPHHHHQEEDISESEGENEQPQSTEINDSSLIGSSLEELKAQILAMKQDTNQKMGKLQEKVQKLNAKRKKEKSRIKLLEKQLHESEKPKSSTNLVIKTATSTDDLSKSRPDVKVQVEPHDEEHHAVELHTKGHPEEKPAGGQENLPKLTPREVWTCTIGLCLAMLMAALDNTIVSTALPTIIADLNATEAQVLFYFFEKRTWLASP